EFRRVLFRSRTCHHTTRGDAPAYFGQSELGVLGGEGQVTRHERSESTAEAPAVDHGDRRLAPLGQSLPLPLRARPPHPQLQGVVADLVDVTEVLLEVHTGGEGLTDTGEHQDSAAVVPFQMVQHADHLVVQRRVHRVALVRAVQRHPRDALVELDENGVAPRFLGALPHREPPLVIRVTDIWVASRCARRQQSSHRPSRSREQPTAEHGRSVPRAVLYSPGGRRTNRRHPKMKNRNKSTEKTKQSFRKESTHRKSQEGGTSSGEVDNWTSKS